jgi:hypothetical protein
VSCSKYPGSYGALCLSLSLQIWFAASKAAMMWSGRPVRTRCVLASLSEKAREKLRGVLDGARPN